MEAISSLSARWNDIYGVCHKTPWQSTLEELINNISFYFPKVFFLSDSVWLHFFFFFFFVNLEKRENGPEQISLVVVALVKIAQLGLKRHGSSWVSFNFTDLDLDPKPGVSGREPGTEVTFLHLIAHHH